MNGVKLKTVEVRDAGTFIPVQALRVWPKYLDSADQWLWRRAGYVSGSFVLLTKLDGCETHYDWTDWNSYTMQLAHRELVERWYEYASGDVLDVRVVNGTQAEPAPSERRFSHE